MDKGLFIACMLAAGGLAGCASNVPPDTTAMGAGPSCDLRIDVSRDHRCAVAHMQPADPAAQLDALIDDLQQRTTPRR